MSLVIDITVNRLQQIGTIYAHRIEGGIGKPCTYKCSVDTRPHPLTEKFIEVDNIEIEHHYNDSVLSLLKKILEAVDPPPCRMAEPGELL